MALSALLACACLCASTIQVVRADAVPHMRARFGLKGLDYNVDGYDRHGYDALGFDTDGYDTLGRPVTDDYAGTASGTCFYDDTDWPCEHTPNTRSNKCTPPGLS